MHEGIALAGSFCVVSSTWFSSLQKMNYFFLIFRTHYIRKMSSSENRLPSSNRKMPSSEHRMPNSNSSIPCCSKKTPSLKRKMLNFDIKMKKVVVSMPYCFRNTNSFNKNVINFAMKEISFNEKVVAHCPLNQ